MSVKLTGLGLKLSYDLCRDDLEAVLREAARLGNFVRIDMEDSSTTSDTLRMYRELRERGHRQRRGRAAGVSSPHARRHRGARGPEAERPSLQGHLRRARSDRVHRRRRGARELRPLARRAARGRLVRRGRNARRMADRRGSDSRRRDEPERVRVPDAARRARAARGRARRRGAPLARVRAVRRAVVPVLAAPSAGEPRDGGHDRAGDRRPGARPRS